MRLPSRRLLIAVVLFLAAVFAGACSRDLSRDAAASLVSGHLKLPAKITQSIDVGELIMPASQLDFYFEALPFVKKAIDEGLLTFDVKGEIVEYNIRKQTRVLAPTEKAIPYLVGKQEPSIDERGLRVVHITVVVGEKVLDTITGIAKEDTGQTAQVEYTLKMTNLTPFGKAFGFVDGKAEQGALRVRLYDDGWRVEANPNK